MVRYHCNFQDWCVHPLVTGYRGHVGVARRQVVVAVDDFTKRRLPCLRPVRHGRKTLVLVRHGGVLRKQKVDAVFKREEVVLRAERGVVQDLIHERAAQRRHTGNDIVVIAQHVHGIEDGTARREHGCRQKLLSVHVGRCGACTLCRPARVRVIQPDSLVARQVLHHHNARPRRKRCAHTLQRLRLRALEHKRALSMRRRFLRRGAHVVHVKGRRLRTRLQLLQLHLAPHGPLLDVLPRVGQQVVQLQPQAGVFLHLSPQRAAVRPLHVKHRVVPRVLKHIAHARGRGRRLRHVVDHRHRVQC